MSSRISVDEALDPTVRDLLGQAAEWRLISLLFECPRGNWQADVAKVAAEVGDANLREAAERAASEAEEGAYHSIFGPGGPAPARQVSYLESVELGYLMSEISALYEMFAYRPQTDEALDHVSVEAGFIAYLRLKQAFALSAGDTESAAITAAASERFLNENLSAIAQPLAGFLEHSGVSYLERVGQSLSERVGPPRTATAMPHASQLPVLNDECVLECGDAS